MDTRLLKLGRGQKSTFAEKPAENGIHEAAHSGLI